MDHQLSRRRVRPDVHQSSTCTMNYSLCRANRENFSTHYNEHHPLPFLTIIGWDCQMSMCIKTEIDHIYHFAGELYLRKYGRNAKFPFLITNYQNHLLSVIWYVTEQFIQSVFWCIYSLLVLIQLTVSRSCRWMWRVMLPYTAAKLQSITFDHVF